MQGPAKKNLMMFRRLCGDDALKNVILVTTMWDRVTFKEGVIREDQLKQTPEFWGWMTNKGSKTYRHSNTALSAHDLLRHFLPDFKQTITLDIQQEMVVEAKSLDQTGAGKELNSGIIGEKERLIGDIDEAKEQMLEAITQRDQESVQELQNLQDEYRSKLEQLQNDQDNLKSTMFMEHQERHSQLEAKMHAYQERIEHRLEQQVADATRELREQIKALKEQQTPQLETAFQSDLLPNQHTDNERDHRRKRQPENVPAYTPSNKRLCAGVEDRPEMMRANCCGAIKILAFSPDSQVLASYCVNGTLGLWNTKQFSLKSSNTLYNRALSLSFSPNSQTLAIVHGDGSVSIRDRTLDTFNNINQTFAANREFGSRSTVRFSPDGRSIAFGTDDGIIDIHDLSGTRSGCLLRRHAGPVKCVDFSPDGSTLASCTEGHVIKIWRLETQCETAAIKMPSNAVSHAHHYVCFSPDGKQLAASSLDGTLCLWDPQTRWLLRKIGGPTCRVLQVAFSPNGQRLASYSFDGTIRVWDPATGDQVQKVQDGPKDVNGLAFSSDGQFLASGGVDGVIEQRRVRYEDSVRTIEDTAADYGRSGHASGTFEAINTAGLNNPPLVSPPPPMNPYRLH